jgi:hypothetical protein
MTREQLAAEHVHDTRWWPVVEINAGTATFSPRNLAELLRQLDTDGIPEAPVQLSGF